MRGADRALPRRSWRAWPIPARPRARPFRRRAGAQAGSGRAVRLAAARGGRASGSGRSPAAEAAPPDVAGCQAVLAAIGYPVPRAGALDPATRLVVAAFQRHFRPERVDGAAPIGSTLARRDGLLALLRALDPRRRRRRHLGRDQTAGWPLPGASPGEESPGSTETRCRVTPGGGDPRESATESKPPAGPRLRPARARVKGCGKSAPRRRQRRRHGKPHREQDQIGTSAALRRGAGRFPRRRPGRSREASGNGRPR